MELNELIDLELEDSVIIYTFRTQKYMERRVYGKDKKDEIKFL